MYQLKTEASFDGAHFLTDYHGKCENLHGHRWRVVVYIRQASLGTFDHMFLVEEGSLAPETVACLQREGFTLKMLPFRTTAENLARNFAEVLVGRGLPVSQVDCYETPLNCATYLVDE